MNYPRDIWSAIISWIDCGSDYKATCLVNRAFHDIAGAVHPTADTKFANHTLTLLTMIDRGDYLPNQLNTRVDAIKFIVPTVSSNPNITPEFVDTHLDWPWNWHLICSNKNFTIEWIEGKKDMTKDDWGYGLSSNPRLTIDCVIRNPNAAWCWLDVSRNPGITIDDIIDNIELPWVWQGVIYNPNMTWNDIVRLNTAHPQFMECAERIISSSGFITIDIVKENPDFPWDWLHLTANGVMTIDIIHANPQLPWDMNMLTFNPSLPLEHVTVDMFNQWSYDCNRNFTIEDMRNRRDLPWKQYMVFDTPGITWKDIESEPHDTDGNPWQIRHMSGKRDLTWKKIVELDRNGTEWNWWRLCRNPFQMVA